MKNPLIKRIPKELVAEWHKYAVIVIFMVLMIGVVSGMYVGHDSLMATINAGPEELNLEDGCFELKKKASQELLDDLSKGDMADVRSYFIDKGTKEADEEVAKAIEENLNEEVTKAIEDAVREQCLAFGITDEQMIREQTDAALEEKLEDALEEARGSEDFQKAVEEAYSEAHEEVVKAVDEEWDETAKRYELDEEGFVPVPIKIYEHFYREEAEDNDNDGNRDATVRIFKSDSAIDKAAFIEGRAPETDSEIAIDRMHASNAGAGIGDSISIGGRKYEIVGLLSYVNYLTLHESNTDLMFDSFGFDVAMLTPSGFDRLSSRVHYEYSYKYPEKTDDKIELADRGNRLLKALITQTLVHDNEIEDFLPEYLRQASNFAPSDIDGDSTTTAVLCYVLIAVIAFIFAITINNTIEKEASVIGTLRASGYSRSELVVHYMTMPVIVTLFGALLGNVLGYTAFRNLMMSLYYESYSLPPCGFVWSRTALVKTTIIPLILMFFINLIVIVKKLQLSPLRFLRHDLATKKRSKAMRLPSWSFLSRFRLRILFQNIPNYIVLAFGVIFIELMMCFAFGLPDSLNNYGDKASEMMFAEYQYMLMSSRDSDNEVIETSEETAERFSAKTLLFPRNNDAKKMRAFGSGKDESVTVYGIADDSSYVSLASEGTYISSAFSEKYGLGAGDGISLHEEYENKSYDFTIAGVVDYDGAVAVFMDRKSFGERFDMDEDEFSGYFSQNEIKDIDEEYIATVITSDDMAKVTVQLMHSFGSVIDVFKYVLVVLAAALIYLLAKIIIERNEHSISMVKILGFLNGEIGSLYIRPTAVVVTLFAVAGFAAGYGLMLYLFKVIMLSMDGYFRFFMKPVSMVLSVVYLLIGYALVSVIDYFRIKKIPMDVALKNVE
ncbi:MAG: permease [Lachnospiraceae bacterium]|nr:permease [Lachnospiraceae bacterium]